MSHVDMGGYEVVSNVETPECSLRLLRLSNERFVHLHHHHQATQTYFVLEGVAQVMAGGQVIDLEPNQSLRVPVDTVHSIRTESGALVLSISIPPLEASDQHLATEH